MQAETINGLNSLIINGMHRSGTSLVARHHIRYRALRVICKRVGCQIGRTQFEFVFKTLDTGLQRTFFTQKKSSGH